METNKNQNDDGILQDINRLYFIASAIFVLSLIILYFIIASTEPPEDSIWFTSRMFSLEILGDVIPVFLLFIGSFVLLRRIQAKQVEKSTEEIIRKIRTELNEIVNESVGTQAITPVLPEETITNVYFQQTNEERNRQKRYVLRQARGKVQLLAHTGNSYLASGGRFYGEIKDCLSRRVEVQVLLLNPWSFTGFAIALGEQKQLNHMQLRQVKEQINGKAVKLGIDPVDLIERSESYSGKLSASLSGYKVLENQFGDRTTVRFVNFDVAATILLTEEYGFFEPYVNVNLSERAVKRLHTFEVQFLRTSYFSETCQTYFDLLWDLSVTYDEFMTMQDDWKVALRDKFT